MVWFQPELYQNTAREFARVATSDRLGCVRAIQALAMANDAESYGAEGMALLLDEAVRSHTRQWGVCLASPMLDANCGQGIYVALCPAANAPKLPPNSLLQELVPGMRLFRFATFVSDARNCFVAQLVAPEKLECRRAAHAAQRALDLSEFSLWRMVKAATHVLASHLQEGEAPETAQKLFNELALLTKRQAGSEALEQASPETDALEHCLRLIFTISLLLGLRPWEMMQEVGGRYPATLG